MMTNQAKAHVKSNDKSARSRALNDQAVALHLRRDMESARAAYEAAVATDPRNASAHNNLGFLLAQAGDYKAALRHLRRAVRLKPGDANAQVNLGQVLAAQGRTADGIAALERAVELEPGNSKAWDNLGRVQLIAGDLGAAEASWRRGMQAEPASPVIATRLATALALQAREDEAILLLETTTRRSPDHAEAWTQLGVLRYLKRDLASARSALQRALGLNRRDAGALRHLALVELACERREAALRIYDELLDVDPSRDADRLDRAVLLLSVGKPAPALDDLDVLAERDVDDSLEPRLRFYQALALSELGRSEQARPLLRAVAAGDSEYAGRAREILGRENEEHLHFQL